MKTFSYPLQDPSSFLKGNLASSSFTQSFLNDLLTSVDDFHATMMHDILEAARSSEYANWSVDDWLCEDCVQNLLSNNLHLWLLYRKRQCTSRLSCAIVRHLSSYSPSAGETIPEDCWYGYNCRTQTHRLGHARKLNVSTLPL